MARAVALLARREHSRTELARKLARPRPPRPGVEPDPPGDPEEIVRVLDELERQNLLSDQRFASALVRHRAQRYGDLRVARDLRDRGIDGAEATRALDGAGDEAQRALAVWSRRYTVLPTDAAERAKQGRYLQARGFSMETIRLVLAGRVTRDDDQAT